jgi:hypothetical protein
MQSMLGEFIMITLFILVSFLVYFLPTYVDPTWVHITYSAIFASIGAFTRYIFSKLNTRNSNFPLGTFTVNVLGSWLAAAFTLISKFSVEYYDYRV